MPVDAAIKVRTVPRLKRARLKRAKYEYTTGRIPSSTANPSFFFATAATVRGPYRRVCFFSLILFECVYIRAVASFEHATRNAKRTHPSDAAYCHVN